MAVKLNNFQKMACIGTTVAIRMTSTAAVEILLGQKLKAKVWAEIQIQMVQASSQVLKH
jgi:hypothetical protein